MSWIEANWFWVFWALLFAFMSLEALWPLFEKGASRASRWPTNVAFGLLNGALAASLPVMVVVAGQWAEASRVGLLNVIDAPWGLALPASFLLRSLAQYASHVLMHKVPAFWRLHRVHHCDTAFDVSTALRGHPVEWVLNALLVAPFVVLFGLNPIVLVAYELCEVIANLVTHMNLRLAPALDRYLRVLLVTPAMHCIHHSAHRPETDSNYGVLFTLWDRAFRTYRGEPERSYEAMQLGLPEVGDARAADLLWQLQSPWRDYPEVVEGDAGDGAALARIAGSVSAG